MNITKHVCYFYLTYFKIIYKMFLFVKDLTDSSII
jgi:hypothetical protein